MTTQSSPGSEIESEALHWVFRAEQDRSQRCRDELLEWMGRSDKHARKFMVAQTALNAFARVDFARLPSEPHTAQARVPAKPNRASLACAMIGVAILVVACTWFGIRLAHEQAAATTISWYTTERDKQGEITLSDTTRVHMDASSELAVSFTQRERYIQQLSGGALYQVHRDEGRPFLVASGTSLTRSVGTAYSTVLSDLGTTVSVIEGAVSVTQICEKSSSTLFDRLGDFFRHPFAPQQKPPVRWVDIRPGEVVTVSAHCEGKPLEPRKVSRAQFVAALAWTHEWLSLDAEPLSEAVGRFNAFNVRKMVVRDPVIGRRLVSGDFWAADPESFLRALESSFGVRVVRSDVIYLEGEDCKWQGDHCERIKMAGNPITP